MQLPVLLRDPTLGTQLGIPIPARFNLIFRSLPARNLSGFTLIELMMVISVTAILAMIAIPNFQELLAKSRVNGSVNLLTTSFDLARSEALSKNRATIMCRSADPMAVVPACISTITGDFAADDWATGWIIYSKPTNFDISVVGAPLGFDSTVDQLVRRVLPFANSGNSKRMTMVLNPSMGEIAFSPSGIRFSPAATEPIITVDFRLKSDPISTVTAKCVGLNLLGRAAVSSPVSTSC